MTHLFAAESSPTFSSSEVSRGTKAPALSRTSQLTLPSARQQPLRGLERMLLQLRSLKLPEQTPSVSASTHGRWGGSGEAGDTRVCLV